MSVLAQSNRARARSLSLAVSCSALGQYFNKSLPLILLYRHEREQYDRYIATMGTSGASGGGVESTDAGGSASSSASASAPVASAEGHGGGASSDEAVAFRPSTVYGAEHVLRFFTNLTAVLGAATSITSAQVRGIEGGEATSAPLEWVVSERTLRAIQCRALLRHRVEPCCANRTAMPWLTADALCVSGSYPQAAQLQIKLGDFLKFLAKARTLFRCGRVRAQFMGARRPPTRMCLHHHPHVITEDRFESSARRCELKPQNAS